MPASERPESRNRAGGAIRPSIDDGFALLLAGDLISSRPLAPWLGRDAGFAGVARKLIEASLAIGDLQTPIVDSRTFGGHPRIVSDWRMVARPDVARDLVRLGLRLVSRANDRCCDRGIEGLGETGCHLDQAGIGHVVPA